MELEENGKANAIAEEVFSSIRTVLSYNGQEKEQQRFEYLMMKHKFIYIIIDMKNS